MPVPLYIYFILFSLLVAVFRYPKLRSSGLIWFVPFLFITLAVELAGVYYKYVLNKDNAWLYNAYLLLQVAFFSVLYYRFIQVKTYRWIIRTGALLYFVGAAIIYIFYDSILGFNRLVFMSGGLLVTLFGVLFLFFYFSLDSSERETALTPLLFITMGIVIYFAVLSITLSLYQFSRFHNLEIGGVKLYNFIPRLVSIVLYTLYAFSFFICRPRKQI